MTSGAAVTLAPWLLEEAALFVGEESPLFGFVAPVVLTVEVMDGLVPIGAGEGCGIYL